jgi:hypothetical protein
MYEHNQELQGEVLQPETVQRSTRLPSGGQIQPSYPFVAVFHHAWEYLENERFPEGKWLPQLAEVRTTPNGNGVKVESGQIRSGAMIQGLKEKKSIVIDRYDPRLGEHGAYLKRVLLDTGKYMYVYSWVTFALIENGRRAVARKDVDTEYRFRQCLIDSKMIPPMPRHSVDTRVRRLRETLRRLQREADRARLDHETHTIRRDEIEGLIARMYAAWDREFAGIQVLATPQAETDFDLDVGAVPAPGGSDGVEGIIAPSTSAPTKRGRA